MASLASVLEQKTLLSSQDREWLAALVKQWRLLADTSFSDLILWVQEEDPNIYVAVAQVRPSTGPTALEEDVIGERIVYDEEHLVTEAFMSEEICETSDNKLQAGIPVDIWAVPIVRHGECIAVVEKHTNQMGVRAPGNLEDNYLEISHALTEMLHHGKFPVAEANDPSVTPNVGDGVIRVAPNDVVLFASPNATTAFRRLGYVGDLEGEEFTPIVRRYHDKIAEIGQNIAGDLAKGKPLDAEVTKDHVVIRMRIIPVWMGEDGGSAPSWVVLVRDISDLRLRERQLVTKNATIHEIHHRVKNNLQTVAALLRMQVRRASTNEAKHALMEATRRVQAISLVHEILSHSYAEEVDFDEVADQILLNLEDVAASHGHVVSVRTGSFGTVGAHIATNLAMIITELCQNAVEHGLGSGSVEHEGVVEVLVDNDGEELCVKIRDNGNGVPDGFDVAAQTSSLGLSIVSTLISDLNGSFELYSKPGQRGATAEVRIPLHR